MATLVYGHYPDHGPVRHYHCDLLLNPGSDLSGIELYAIHGLQGPLWSIRPHDTLLHLPLAHPFYLQKNEGFTGGYEQDDGLPRGSECSPFYICLQDYLRQRRHRVSDCPADTLRHWGEHRV